MQVTITRFQDFAQVGNGPTTSMATMGHGAEISRTETSGAG